MVTLGQIALIPREFSHRERLGFSLIGSFLIYVISGASAILAHCLAQEWAEFWAISALLTAPCLTGWLCLLLPECPAPEYLASPGVAESSVTSWVSCTPGIAPQAETLLKIVQNIDRISVKKPADEDDQGDGSNVASFGQRASA